MNPNERYISSLENQLEKAKAMIGELEKARLGEVKLPDDEKITDLAFDNGFGMDINTPKLQSAEHIACCAGIRIGANFVFNQFKPSPEEKDGGPVQ